MKVPCQSRWLEVLPAVCVSPSEIYVTDKYVGLRYEFRQPPDCQLSLTHPKLGWDCYLERSLPSRPHPPQSAIPLFQAGRCFVFVKWPWYYTPLQRQFFLNTWAKAGYGLSSLCPTSEKPAHVLLTQPGSLLKDIMSAEELANALTQSESFPPVSSATLEQLKRGWVKPYEVLCRELFVEKEAVDYTEAEKLLVSCLHRSPIAATVFHRTSQFVPNTEWLTPRGRCALKESLLYLFVLILAQMGLILFLCQWLRPSQAVLSLGVFSLLTSPKWPEKMPLRLVRLTLFIQSIGIILGTIGLFVSSHT